MASNNHLILMILVILIGVVAVPLLSDTNFGPFINAVKLQDVFCRVSIPNNPLLVCHTSNDTIHMTPRNGIIMTTNGTNNTVFISFSGNIENFTFSNVGAGSQVLKGLSGMNVQYRTLTQGIGIGLTQTANEIQIASNFRANTQNCGGTDKFSGLNNVTGVFTCTTDQNTAQIGNSGNGFSLFGSRINATQNNLKTLRGGSGITLSSNGTDVTITNSGGTDTNTAQGKNLFSTNGAGTGVYASNFNATELQFKSITGNNGITVTSNGTNINIAAGGGNGAIKTINGQNGPTVNIVHESGNTTIINSTNQVQIGLGTNPFLINLAEQTISKRVLISQSSASNALQITQLGNAGTSVSSGGAINLVNTGNDGAGMTIYTNNGASGTGRLLNIESDNAAFAGRGLSIVYNGATFPLFVQQNSNTTGSIAVDITSTNENDTTLGVTGHEMSRGTIKASHVHVANHDDTNAAVLSLRVNGLGTKAQGIFLDSEDNGTTGKLLNIRNNGTELLTMYGLKGGAGIVGINMTNPTIPLEVYGKIGMVSGGHLYTFAQNWKNTDTVTLPDCTCAIPASTISFIYNSGAKQTVHQGSTAAGFSLGSNLGLPSAPVHGDVVYDATPQKLYFRHSSTWQEILENNTAQTFTNKKMTDNNIFVNSADNTKGLIFGGISVFSANHNNTATWQNKNGTVAYLSDITGGITGSQNVGKGTGSFGVLAAPTSTTIKGKNMTAGTNISLSGNTTDITITNNSPESTSSQNIGKGTGSSGVLASMSSNIIRGKNITTTSPITNSNNSTDVTIACSTCLTSAILSSQNVGKATSSVGVLSSPTSSIVKGKNVTGTSPITVTSTNSTDFAIGCSTCVTSDVDTGIQTSQNVGKGTGSFGFLSSPTSSIVKSKNATAGTGISLAGNTTDITFTNSGIISASGTTGNITVSGTNPLAINTGYNIMVTNGNNQTVSKSLQFSCGTKWACLLLPTTVTPTSPRKGSIWLNSGGLLFNDNSNVTQTVDTLALSQTISGAKTNTGTTNFQGSTNQFASGNLLLENPAKTFAYDLTGSAITGNRSITFPLTTGSDTLAVLGLAQTYTGLDTFNKGAKVLGLTLNVTAVKSSSYTVSCTDDYVQFDTSSANLTATLTSAVACGSGKIFMIKDIGLGKSILTVTTQSSQTIDGFTQFNMTHNNETAVFISNGANYARVSGDTSPPNAYYPRGATSYVFSNVANPSTTSTLLFPTGVLRAWLMPIPYNMQIDKIYVEVSTAANPTSNTCRVGLYKDNGHMMPSSLIIDSGTFDGTLAVKTISISATNLQKGLDWFVATCGTAATTQPTFRAIGVSGTWTLGLSTAMGVNSVDNGISVAFTYGALPSTFPSGSAITLLANNPVLAGFEVIKG